MVLPNSHPDKWDYPPHTKHKHEILSRYVWTWLNIVGSKWPRLRIFDCFAGRGSYLNGVDGFDLINIDTSKERPGSPLIILDAIISQKEKQNRSFEKVDLVCIEKNSDNFSELEKILSSIRIPDYVNIILKQDSFESCTPNLIEKTGKDKYPAFLFIDPFGFESLCYDTVSEFASTPKFDFLLTFMVRDIKRFLDSTLHEKAIKNVFGRSILEVRDEVGKLSPDRWEPVAEYYISILEDDVGVKYPLAYSLTEEGSSKILYYLIFGTNHYKGLEAMRGNMWNAGMKGRFTFDQISRGGKTKQTTLLGADDKAVALEKELMDRFKGLVVTYQEIKEKMAEEKHIVSEYKDEHYRQAVKNLERENRAEISRKGKKRQRGVKDEDIIGFKPNSCNS